MIYLHKNGVTVVASNEAKRGKVYELNGEEYYVARGVSDIKRIVDSGEYPLNRVVTSKLTTLNYLFQIRGGWNNRAVPENFNDDITNWDTSNVTEMKEVFSGWPTFNQDISNWDTSKVESMHGMFKTSKKVGNYYSGPSSFNGPIGNWDVSNVVDMSEMFLGATSFNQPIGIWDVSNVEDMNYMFSGATSFNQDISNWDVSNVKIMHSMFCNITSIGIVAFVGTYEHDYADFTSFNQDISNWDVSSVENMNSMFSGATSFNQPIGNWNVSKVESMNSMFSGAKSFNQPIGNWNVSKVESIWGMFCDATSFNQDISNWDVSNINDMSLVFLRATSFNQDISNWNVSKVESMSSMFSGATSFNQDISNWNVSNVGSMNHMFKGATSFNQELNGWNAVSSVVGMFYGATSFNSPIGKWKLTAVADMENMFREATSFNQDISGWDVSNVIQMKGLFQDATSFNQDLRSWKLNDKLPKSRTIFTGATAFKIKEHSPFLNIKTKRVNVATQAAESLGIELTSEDKKTISKIKKLLTARDLEQVDLGLELLRSLDKTEVYETLLFDCRMSNKESSNTTWRDSEGGKLDQSFYTQLVRNKMFTGTKAAQPFLDYALLNLIADAPKGAKVDDSIDKENITSLDLKLFNLNFGYSTKIEQFLSFNKFFNLESLVIELGIFSIKTVKDNGVDLEQVLNNNKISNLKVKDVRSNLDWLKNFQNLKKLDIDFSSELTDDDFDHFKYLKNLEELKFKSGYFKNLDFLDKCKKIKNFNLSLSYSGYNSNALQLENIDFLGRLPELEYFALTGNSSELDKSGLYNCKKLKYLTIPISGDTDLSGLKKCDSLESLNFGSDSSYSSGSFDVTARIYELNGLKNLKNLKKLSLGSFNFFGVDGGNLMNDTKQEKSNIDNKVSLSDIQMVDNVIRYKAIPYTGTVVNHSSYGKICEYEVVDGIQNGIYKEFYETGKVKLEALIKKNRPNKITGFYNAEGENILGNKGAVLGFDLSSLDVHRIGGDSGGFVKNDKPYNGFCYIELVPSWSSWSKTKWEKNDLFTNLKHIIDIESFDFENQMESNKFSLLGGRKISIILKINQGIISNTIFFAGEKHCAKITVADNYNFNRMPSYVSEEDKLEFMKIENEKQHRLDIYFNKMSEWNICIDGEKQIEIDQEVEPILKAYIETNAHIDSLESGKTNEVYWPLWYYLTGLIDGKQITKKQKNLERPKLSSEDRKAFSEIKKQLTSRDYDKIDQAISKLVSLNIDELFETLLEGCELKDEYPGLTKNKFFTGSSPAQPFLNYALFCLILNAPESADIHDSIKNKNITKLNVDSFSLSARYSAGKTSGGVNDRFIPIDNLTSLSDLTIDFKIFEERNKGPKNTDRSGWFKKSNITKLTAEVSGSLKFFENLKSLKYLDLKFSYYYESITDLKSLESLENLEEIKIDTNRFKTLKSLDFLKNNKKLKKLDIEIGSSWDTGQTLENLDVIQNFNQLEELNIYKIKSTDLKSLSSCKNLKKLNLRFEKYDSIYFDFSILKTCNSLESLSVDGSKNYNLDLKIVDFNTLNGLKNLKNLKVGDVSLNNSTSIFID